MSYKKGPEKILQDAVLKYLHARGIFCWAQKNAGTFDPVKKIFRRNTTMKGVSDILGLLPNDGRMLAIELKAKTPVSPEQKVFLEKVKQDGGISGVARCLEDVMEIIDEAIGK